MVKRGGKEGIEPAKSRGQKLPSIFLLLVFVFFLGIAYLLPSKCPSEKALEAGAA
jgi:hypothetical protein